MQMSRPALVSVIETPEFLAAARRIMGDDERGLLVIILPAIRLPAT